MSTSDTIRPTSFPYTDVADAAEAVHRFFCERVNVSSGQASGGKSLPELTVRVCDIVADTVRDRLTTWHSGTKPFGENEELEFEFKRGEHSNGHKLEGSVPLIKYLEYCFRGLGLYLYNAPLDSAHTGSGNTIFLRVSPRLVTFGGHVVWQASDEVRFNIGA